MTERYAVQPPDDKAVKSCVDDDNPATGPAAVAAPSGHDAVPAADFPSDASRPPLLQPSHSPRPKTTT
ncbi:hypothetical protein MTO96_042746 [Rhipicephalus appendiculatus]